VGELELLHDGAAGKTVEGSAIGTPAYMSPEQADGAIDQIDERSDVWSLGAVLYELLTGRPPFEGVTPYEILGKVLRDDIPPAREVEPAAPAELSAVAAKALTRAKARRYQGAQELADATTAYMSGRRTAVSFSPDGARLVIASSGDGDRRTIDVDDVADGAGDVQTLLEKHVDEPSFGRRIFRLIDLWHVLEKLGEALALMERDERQRFRNPCLALLPMAQLMTEGIDIARGTVRPW
jgi:serine/threonine protein kinase